MAAHYEYRCTDCRHAHNGPHGFCECGCTYPGAVEVLVEDKE